MTITNSVYPKLSEPEGSQFRLENVRVILEEIMREKKHYKVVYKKYKRIHQALFGIQLISQTTSVATSAGAITTALVFQPAAPVLGGVGLVMALLGTSFSIFDTKVQKKLRKHAKMEQLASSLEREILSKYMFDNQVTEEEFQQIVKMLERYNDNKEQVRYNHVLRSDVEKIKKEYTEQGKKLALFEAVKINSLK